MYACLCLGNLHCFVVLSFNNCTFLIKLYIRVLHKHKYSNINFARYSQCLLHEHCMYIRDDYCSTWLHVPSLSLIPPLLKFSPDHRGCSPCKDIQPYTQNAKCL